MNIAYSMVLILMLNELNCINDVNVIDWHRDWWSEISICYSLMVVAAVLQMKALSDVCISVVVWI